MCLNVLSCMGRGVTTEEKGEPDQVEVKTTGARRHEPVEEVAARIHPSGNGAAQPPKTATAAGHVSSTTTAPRCKVDGEEAAAAPARKGPKEAAPRAAASYDAVVEMPPVEAKTEWEPNRSEYSAAAGRNKSPDRKSPAADQTNPRIRGYDELGGGAAPCAGQLYKTPDVGGGDAYSYPRVACASSDSGEKSPVKAIEEESRPEQYSVARDRNKPNHKEPPADHHFVDDAVEGLRWRGQLKT